MTTIDAAAASLLSMILHDAPNWMLTMQHWHLRSLCRRWRRLAPDEEAKEACGIIDGHDIRRRPWRAAGVRRPSTPAAPPTRRRQRRARRPPGGASRSQRQHHYYQQQRTTPRSRHMGGHGCMPSKPAGPCSMQSAAASQRGQLLRATCWHRGSSRLQTRPSSPLLIASYKLTPPTPPKRCSVTYKATPGGRQASCAVSASKSLPWKNRKRRRETFARGLQAGDRPSAELLRLLERPLVLALDLFLLLLRGGGRNPSAASPWTGGWNLECNDAGLPRAQSDRCAPA